EYLATDKTDLGMTLCLVREVLTAAKPNLNPDRASPGTEETAGIELARPRDSQRELRQEIADQDVLPRPERPPAAPSEEKRAPCCSDSHSLTQRAAAPPPDPASP